MLVQNPNIELVIAVLKGLNVDGESMQHIIEQVGMTEQMKSQLGAPASDKAKELVLTPVELESLVNGIVNDIDDCIEDIVDVEFSLNGNYLEVDSHNVSTRKLESIISNALDVYITVQEPDNAL